MNARQKWTLGRILTATVLLIGLEFFPAEGLLRAGAYMIPYFIIGYDILRQAVRGILPKYEGRISWRESLVKTKAGIRRMKKLGVANLPVMLINNEVVFNNIVPTQTELTNAIESRL